MSESPEFESDHISCNVVSRYSHSAELEFKNVFSNLKSIKNIEMFNNSQKCIASRLCVLNILGLVFDFKLTYIVFKNIFLTKFLVNPISNFDGFWPKTIHPSNVFLKYFIFKRCTTKLSTD